MIKGKSIAIIAIAGILAYSFYKDYISTGPFDEVEWVEDSPVATERFITFTPVLRSDHTPIGPTVGADYGELIFEDLNGDGIKEAIIETSGWMHLEFYNYERHVLIYHEDALGGPTFVEDRELNASDTGK